MTIEKLKDILETAVEDLENEMALPRIEEGSLEHFELMVEYNTINSIIKLLN